MGSFGTASAVKDHTASLPLISINNNVLLEVDCPIAPSVNSVAKKLALKVHFLLADILYES